TIEGDFTAAPNQFAGTNLKVFVGQGPAFLEDGSRNPLARGVLITDATVGFVKVGGKYALDISGTVELVGFAGVTLGGQIRVRVNATNAAVDQTIVVGDGDVKVKFTDGTGGSANETATGTTPFVSVKGVGLTVGVLGQTFTADLTFQTTASGFTITAANLEL